MKRRREDYTVSGNLWKGAVCHAQHPPHPDGTAGGAYPNGGDEAYWMGQVAGAAGLNSPGASAVLGAAPEGGGLWLAPVLPGGAAGAGGAAEGPGPLLRRRTLPEAGWAAPWRKPWRRPIPQPELIQVRGGPSLPQAGGRPRPRGGGAPAVPGQSPRTRPGWPAAPARQGQALAQGLAQALKGLCPHA